LRPHHHQHDERDAVDDELVEAGLRRIGVDRAPQDGLEQGDGGGAEDRAGEVRHAAEDHDREERESEREAEDGRRGQAQPP
jgi:hypothetical protein